MIQIKNEIISASEHIETMYGFGEAFCGYREFSSHDIKALEKEINEFLDDRIYISATLTYEPVSEEVPINMYYVSVYYQEWPF